MTIISRNKFNILPYKRQCTISNILIFSFSFATVVLILVKANQQLPADIVQ